MSDTVTLCVVDDDDAGRRMLVRALQRRGYHVEQAADGASGVDLVRQVRPAALLLDLRMPGELSGIDVIGVLRDDPDLSHIPVIVVSASVHADVRQLIDKVGAAGFVEKPVDFTVLFETLGSVLGPLASHNA
jgi:CheY-like chemotaxis protein